MSMNVNTKDRICTTQPKSGDKFTGFKILNIGLKVVAPKGLSLP
jgi:hypothetical protein